MVLSHVAKVLGPGAEAFANNRRAKLLAALPYLSGSEDPDRFAVSNLMTLHAAAKIPELFDHRPSDDGDVFRRLATVHVGNRSDPRVVDYGLTLLALLSLEEHERAGSAPADRYNPVKSGAWDSVALRRELEADLARSSFLKEAFQAVVGPSA